MSFWNLGLGGKGSSIFSLAKKKGAQSFTPTPYTGRSPESPSYTKESEKAYYDTILPRSQGVGVGYSPEWLNSSTALINSNLNKSLEDRLRNTAGSLSASGLSGNPRAYEATSGRAQRDTQREQQDALSQLTIADMERKNQERDVNTQRLGDFTKFEFGQGNTAANFDLNKWGQENNQALSAANLNNQNYWNQQGQNDEFINSLIQGGAGVAGMYFGGPAGGAIASQAASALTGSGKGISPSYDMSNPLQTMYNGQPVTGYRKTKLNA